MAQISADFFLIPDTPHLPFLKLSRVKSRLPERRGTVTNNFMQTPKTLAQIGTGLVLGLILPAFTVTAQEARFFRVAGPVSVTITSFTQDGTVTWTNEPVDATFTVQTTTDLAASNWVDWVQVPVTNNEQTIHRICDLNPPAGMAFIPAGSFTMGDNLDGTSDALPPHIVYVSAFYMDKFEVTKALWDEVYQWATNHAYSFVNAGSGKATDHPVQTINWYDAVKWCNARSEKEGRTPAYYTSAAQTTVYRTGQVNLQNDMVKWDGNGYRLPTEAEWEKATRGGVSGQRFPWGNTITHGQANYYSSSSYAYDTSLTRGDHPSYNTGVMPYTSPADSFASTGYGLYGLIGNVSEWCWDWYGSYSSVSQTDSRGPTSGSTRVIRGGSWGGFANGCRTAYRYFHLPVYDYYSIGFRCVCFADQ